MSFALWGMLGAVALLVFAIFAKYKGGVRWFSFNIKRRVIAFGTPKRVELILIALYFITGLWWDILQNQLLTNGLSHRVQWFGSFTTSAWSLALVMLFAFHLILLTLFLFSLASKKTNRLYDLVVGALALFGVGILLSGFFAQMQGFTVPLFGTVLNGTSYYHIGIFVEAFAGLYWAFTD